MSIVETISSASVRHEFPILRRSVNGRPLVYLDSAATTQKPQAVLDAIIDYYTTCNANVHRGAHTLSAEATDRFEKARTNVAAFVNAYHVDGVVFTRGTTESINLVASSWGHDHVSEGDVVVVSIAEHHSNLVPWQMLCERKGATLRTIPLNDDGNLDLDELDILYASGARIALIACCHISNTLGLFNNVPVICAWAAERNITTLIDGAQAVAHVPVDVQAIGCDFYAFSGHKLYAPTGIGVLVAKPDVLRAMKPYQGGGAMIHTVTIEHTTYADIPGRFEAGTPHIEGVLGLAAAIEWFGRIDKQWLYKHEDDVLLGLQDAIKEHHGARILGPAHGTVGVASFVIDGIHAADIGELLDQQGVAIRVGHHCTQPLLQHLQVTSVARASVAAYTTHDDVEAFARALHSAIRMLR